MVPHPRQDGWRVEVREGIPAHAACLDGHFPDNPIVPGAVLLALAARELANEGLEISKLRRMKFLRPLLPGRPLTIAFEVMQDRATAIWLEDETELARAQMTLSANDD